MASLPTIAGLYVGVNALAFVGLSVAVIFARMSRKMSIIGPHYPILREQRAQQNTAEYVPAFAVMMALIELLGGHLLFLHMAGIVFTLGRVAHVVGIFLSATEYLDTGATPPWHPLRSFGVTLTLASMLCCGVYLTGLGLTGMVTE